MSLYSMLFPGGEERGRVLLVVLGYRSFEEVGRFRDAWVERDDTHGVVIHLYTRNGGGNRDDYATEINALRSHECYLRDADDSLDRTYASFWFRIPDAWREQLLGVAIDPVDTAARWQAALAALNER